MWWKFSNMVSAPCIWLGSFSGEDPPGNDRHATFIGRAEILSYPTSNQLAIAWCSRLMSGNPRRRASFGLRPLQIRILTALFKQEPVEIDQWQSYEHPRCLVSNVNQTEMLILVSASIQYILHYESTHCRWLDEYRRQ